MKALQGKGFGATSQPALLVNAFADTERDLLRRENNLLREQASRSNNEAPSCVPVGPPITVMVRRVPDVACADTLFL